MTAALYPANINTTLFSPLLKAVAPSLVVYSSEIGDLVAAIESDYSCSSTFMHYANRRSQDLDKPLSEVRQAVIFLGVIDVKHFLLAYLLLRRDARFRHHGQRLLLRAKLCSHFFQTNGPINKDIAFITAMLTGCKYLNCQDMACVFELFELDEPRQRAIRQLQFGLSEAVQRAIALSSTKAVSDDLTLQLNDSDKERFQETVYWANTVVGSLCCPV